MSETQKKHSILINEELFTDIKEYVDLNHLKLGSFVNELLANAFLVEKYGNVPTVLQKIEQEPIPEKIQNVIDNHFWEMLDNDKTTETEDTEEKPEITVPQSHDPLQEEDNKLEESTEQEPIQIETNINIQTVDKPKRRRLK